MKKSEILKQVARQDNQQNVVEIVNNYERKIPMTSLNLNFKAKQH